MAQSDILTCIDHPVIAVRDMVESHSVYERLGFTIPPRGSHLEWGTGNWCIMFADSYLELRGIIDPNKYTHGLDKFLEQGEGLMGVALGTNDAQRSHDLLVARQLHPQQVRSLTRNFELPDGNVQPRFSLCFQDPTETPGLMSVVLCQHLTPELLRRPEWLQHKNGAQGVLGMVGVVADLERAAEVLGPLFGTTALEFGSDRLSISVGKTQTIVLLSPKAAKNEFEECKPLPPDEAGQLVAVRISVKDIGETKRFFDSQKIAYQEHQKRVIRALPSEACGTILDFAE